jgi:hypothetical protein
MCCSVPMCKVPSMPSLPIGPAALLRSNCTTITIGPICCRIMSTSSRLGPRCAFLSTPVVWRVLLHQRFNATTNKPPTTATAILTNAFITDVDIATVPHAYTQLCLSYLNRPSTSKWRRWTVNGVTAGYVETYDRYTFATVRGAGHEVPTFTPYFAFYMYQQFLNNKPL